MIQTKMKNRITYAAMIVLVIGLAVFPLVMNKNAEFAGADDRAGAAIAEQNPDYKPWFSSIWTPPSSEVASMLFALQAAAGSGVVCFAVGFYVGRSRST